MADRNCLCLKCHHSGALLIQRYATLVKMIHASSHFMLVNQLGVSVFTNLFTVNEQQLVELVIEILI